MWRALGLLLTVANIASRRVQLHTASQSKEHSDRQSRSTPRHRAHRTV